jgi:hypothetical protein
MAQNARAFRHIAYLLCIYNSPFITLRPTIKNHSFFTTAFFPWQIRSSYLKSHLVEIQPLASLWALLAMNVHDDAVRNVVITGYDRSNSCCVGDALAVCTANDS